MKTDRAIGVAGIALALLGTVTVTSASAQSAPPVRVRGSVESIDGQDLTVKSRDGNSVKIKLAPDYTVTAVVKAEMTDVVVGKYVGIAAIPQANNAEKALEVLILPESARLRRRPLCLGPDAREHDDQCHHRRDGRPSRRPCAHAEA